MRNKMKPPLPPAGAPKFRAIGPQVKSLGNLVVRFLESENSKTDFDNITCANGWILRYLRENEGKDIYQKDIEKKFCITRSTASKVVSLMEQKGYVKRVSVERDGRLKKLELTPLSHELMEHRRRTGDRCEEILSRGLSGEEIEEFYRLTDKMKDSLRAALEGGEVGC